jgi:hypothetical protein
VGTTIVTTGATQDQLSKAIGALLSARGMKTCAEGSHVLHVKTAKSGDRAVAWIPLAGDKNMAQALAQSIDGELVLLHVDGVTASRWSATTTEVKHEEVDADEVLAEWSQDGPEHDEAEAEAELASQLAGITDPSDRKNLYFTHAVSPRVAEIVARVREGASLEWTTLQGRPAVRLVVADGSRIIKALNDADAETLRGQLAK